MRITLNGDMREVTAGTSVRELIVTLGFIPDATAVQRNDEILERSAYADTILAEGDKIELVRFVGGG